MKIILVASKEILTLVYCISKKKKKKKREKEILLVRNGNVIQNPREEKLLTLME